MKYPKAIIDGIDEQKLEELRKITVDGYVSTSSSPDRVVKKYIKGIKNN